MPKIGILTSSMDSAFVSQALAGFEKAAKDRGLEMELYETHMLSRMEVSSTIKSIAMEKDLVGLAYVYYEGLSNAAIMEFAKANIPLVNFTQRQAGVPWVMADDFKGSAMAAKHLIDQGHKRFGLINGPGLAPATRMREQGFAKTLAENGLQAELDSAFQILNYGRDEGFAAGELLMKQDKPPTALFVAAGDVTALGVMESLKEKGLKVPRDVSVVGYDNLEFASTTDPPLTTVAQPLDAMTERAVDIMIRTREGQPGDPLLGETFDPQLIVRASTAPPKNL